MKFRKFVIGAVLIVFGLPLALVLIASVSFYALDRTNGTIVSSGQKREYLLYVSRSYDRTKPAPLVISMHAGALWPAEEMAISGWNKLADGHGFIVVYPAGDAGVLGPRLPRGPKIWDDERLNVKFISDLIDELEAEYNIDPARIFVDGMSNGGGMALEVSCKLSHRVAAVGAVAAALLRPVNGCEDYRPVPTVAFHGTADPLAPYQGGTSLASPPGTGMPFLAVRDWVASRARLNRCGPNPVESAMTADVTRLEYSDCADDAAVMLYTLKGAGHQWPGGKQEWFLGPTSRSIDASSLMWAFFREHPLPRK